MVKDNGSFAPLHVHTSYSRFDGCNKVNDLVLQSRKMGFKSLAVTDHGTVASWIKFYKECKKKKDKNENELLGANGKPLPPIKPILGIETYLSRNLLSRGIAEQPDGRKGNRHLVLLARNNIGYKNICALSQKAYIDGAAFGDPRIDLNLLLKHSEGVIAGSACLSSVINNNLLYGRFDAAKRAATLFKDIFKEDFYLEVMYHGIDAEQMIIPEIIKLGKQLDILVCATNDTHYLHKHQASSQELLMAMSTSKCIKDPKAYHFPYAEFYLKSAEEMSLIFGSSPELIYNTCAIAERVEDYLRPGVMRLPKFDIVAAAKERNIICDHPEKLNPQQFIEIAAMQGMRKLGWDKLEPYLKRLRLELNDLDIAMKNNKMDFATYCLIVWDYIAFAKQQGIRTGGGRGSGSASLLLRVLGITSAVDPVATPSLLWSRFLTFDDSYFLLDDDWGMGAIAANEATIDISEDSEDVDDDLLEERDAEEDTGGVDRY